MTLVLSVVAPVFGIILCGLLVSWFRLLPETTGKGLSDFVFNVAMPAYLFHTMAVAEPSGDAPVWLVLTYFGSNLVIWLLASLAATRLLGRPANEAAALAMAACFGNTVMLGLPLGSAYFGTKVASAIAAIIALHPPILWTVATLQQEWINRQGGPVDTGRLRQVAWDLAKNPIILSVIAGSLWKLSGLGMPLVSDGFLALLGQCAVPGALFALGLSLSRFEIRSDVPVLALLVSCKLGLMPLFAWLIASHVAGLGREGVDAVTILAGCPTGVNAYLFASRYNSATSPVSAAIALGTALSVVTVSALLLLLGAR
jgi:predicted permease